MTLQAHGKCVPSEDTHTHVHTFKCTQLHHLHTPVPIAGSPVRAQAPPASRFHPRPDTPGQRRGGGKGSPMPGSRQPRRTRSPSKAPMPARDSRAPSRAGAQRRIPAPIRTCAQPTQTWQRWKPTSNPSGTCSRERHCCTALGAGRAPAEEIAGGTRRPGSPPPFTHLGSLKGPWGHTCIHCHRSVAARGVPKAPKGGGDVTPSCT